MSTEAEQPQAIEVDSFFEEQKEQSQVKATIVSKYFWAWAKVVNSVLDKNRWRNPNPKFAYIDLFAGPGRYKKGAVSTPLMVLEAAIKDDVFADRLVAMFNDAKEEHSQSLEAEITALEGIGRLKHAPSVFNVEVGEDLVKIFESMKLAPTLFFVDPWGYKGLSLRLVNSVLKDWGCDCIFFFNYNRINMGLTNPLVREHMNALFGEVRADELRERLPSMTPQDRELTIVEELSQALKEMGGLFVLPFQFINEKGNRTSHHLIFVSKAFRGYEIMKHIMAKESSKTEQGVPSLAYNPADKKYPILFELARPLDDLCDMLLQTYAGRTMTMQQIYEDHNVGTRFIKPNYKDALKTLEGQGKITASPAKRRAGTFADTVIVQFPAIP